MAALAPARALATRERVLARHQATYTKRVDGYFAGFWKRNAGTIARVTAEVKRSSSTKAASQSMVGSVYAKLERIAWDQEARILTRTTTPVLLSTMESATELVGSELGIGVDFDLNARPVRSVLSGVGRRIVAVEDVSRERIANMVAEGIEKGLSVEQIVRGVRPGTANVRGPVPAFQGVRGLVDSWTSTGLPGFAGHGTGKSSRSYLIALTETANAYNRASLLSYQEAGVDFVEVFDGQDCGWTRHDDPDLAHGSIRSVEDAAKTPISHPRCQRAFGARTDATVAAPSPYQFTRDQEVPGAVPGATPGIGAVDVLDADAVAHSGAGGLPRPSPAVAEASQRLWERSRIAEPAITERLQSVVGGRSVVFEDAMQGVAAAPGGDLAGLAARRKTLTSLSRKVETEILDAAKGKPPETITAAQAAARMGDTVRYTVRAAEGEYWDVARRTASELIAGGNRPTKWKPTWTDDASKVYRGTNTNWRAPDGTIFEVQFHTPASFVAKEINHKAYETVRLPSTSEAVKDVLNAEMAARASAVPVPAGRILTLKDVERLARPARAPRAPRAPKVTAQGFSRFDDPEVIAARARVEAAKEAYRRTGKGNQELMEASDAAEAALRNARKRIDDRIAAMSEAEARKALPVVRKAQKLAQTEDWRRGSAREAALRRLNEAPAEAKPALSTAYSEAALASTRATQVLRELEDSITALRLRLPLADRLDFRASRFRPGTSERRVRDLFESVATAVEEELSDYGLRSRWSGQTYVRAMLNAEDTAAGVFTWENALGVTTRTAAYPDQDLLKVLLHESLHSVSPGLRASDYIGRRGWEEGIVEGATQVIEARVRSRMGLPPARGYNTYHAYVGPLQDFQHALGKSDDDFWLGLLRTPTRDRPALLERWVEEAKPRERPNLRRYLRGVETALSKDVG